MSRTVNDCLNWAFSQLESIESGEKIARTLLADVLHHNEAWLWAHPDNEVADSARLGFEGLVRRAVNHEPLAYLLGYAEFFGQRFDVTPSVLIPRPETEQLVDVILDFAANIERPPSIVDVGTGSGCIALTVARQLPDATVYAIDISPAVLQVAQRNAHQHNAHNVIFLEGNLLQPLTGVLEPQTVDVIVANLPYISDSEFAALPQNIRGFEPGLALRSGSDDPDRLNKLLVEQSKEWLRPTGLLAYETTNGQIIKVET